MVDVVFELASDREPGLLVLSGDGIGRAGLDDISAAQAPGKGQ